MMKLLALHHVNRRINSVRGASALDGGVDCGNKPMTSLFWTALHCLCCLISLLLGFRFSRIVFFLLFSSASITTFDSASTLLTKSGIGAGNLPASTESNTTLTNGMVSGSRVVVGRHGIRIRPWPHPNPEEVIRAHRILERVQMEQRLQYGVKDRRNLIVVTPTYVRTFQTLHLTGVMHSLMNCPYDVVWIVVEAGGKTSETASILEKSGIQTIHIGFDQQMPLTWMDRQRMENRMRLLALRNWIVKLIEGYETFSLGGMEFSLLFPLLLILMETGGLTWNRTVRDKKLDGIVMFADDSNMHSMELFDEVQKVKWIGAVSVGILMHTGGSDLPLPKEDMPVQGPICNESEALAGWHAFNASPYAERSAVYIGDMGPVLPLKFEWAGFVLNSQLLWKEDVDRPEWIKDLESLSENEVDSPLSLVKDSSVVEPLGSCGRKVLLWWLRVEARSDSKFPPRWKIDTPLDITVPAKRTPWPETPPELPSHPRDTEAQEGAEKRAPKTRTLRVKRLRNKKKSETRTIDIQESSKQS
ncbi:hypothetical protein V2J09_001991 [Rumex salicifolius]